MASSYNRLVGYLMVGFSLVCCVLWAIVLSGDFIWHRRVTVFYTLEVTLYTTTLREGVVGTIGGAMGDRAKEFFSLKKAFSHREFHERLCMFNIPGFHLCHIWGNVRYVSIAYLYASFTGLLIFIIGCGLAFYNYILGHLSRDTRKQSLMLLTAGPFVLMMSFMMYVAMTSDVGNLPPIVATNELCSSWTRVPMLVMFLVMGSFIPSAIAVINSKASAEEMIREAVQERNQLLLEEQMQGYDPGGYDASSPGMGYGGYGGYGGCDGSGGAQPGGYGGCDGSGGGYGGGPPPLGFGGGPPQAFGGSPPPLGFGPKM